MTFHADMKEEEEPPKDPKVVMRERLQIGGISLGALVVLVLIVMAVIHKDKGTIMFGVCKTFVELSITYPETLSVSEVEQYARAVRIFYSYTDAFGTHKSEFVECAFHNVPGKGAQLTTILLNRKDIDKETIDEFNQSISAIVEADPDLVLPRPFGDDLVTLKE